MRHTLAWGLITALLVVVVAVAAMQWFPPQTTDAPGTPATAPRSEPAYGAPVASPLPSESEGRPEPAAGEVRVKPARLDDIAGNDDPVPATLAVDAIGINGAPVDAVGVEADGGMEIPDDISRVGWYRYGPEPGADEGTAVLTAHIDDRTQGRGVFYDLDELQRGDGVEVQMSDESVRRFTVDEVRQIPKVDLPTGDLFRRDGAARLALITCGGQFDAASRHYRDNLVVLASPAS